MAKSCGVVGDDVLSLPGGTQPPTEGRHKAQVVPAAAFDLNLLLHISQSVHLLANLEQAEREGLHWPLHPGREIHWKLLLKFGLQAPVTNFCCLTNRADKCNFPWKLPVKLALFVGWVCISQLWKRC